MTLASSIKHRLRNSPHPKVHVFLGARRIRGVRRKREAGADDRLAEIERSIAELRVIILKARADASATTAGKGGVVSRCSQKKSRGL